MWFSRSISRFRQLSSRSFGSLNLSYKSGDNIHGYKVVRTTEIPELAISAIQLKHEKSGTEHLHLARDDSNNCFNVVFRTTPADNTGVPHILEHLVLCGSENFPCKDPFFKMTTRSLATFLNAMTAPDSTMFPFSTTNVKDYYNLMNVYLDAVFFPKLNATDFLQEAWRVAPDSVENANSPLKIKGVVFNEMKGAFSSQSQIYYRFLLNSLFPDTTYNHESGGDPLEIPKLTHENLKRFHSTYYHPSNARFMTYGNFPLESHLQVISERVLSKFNADDNARKRSHVPLQPRWSEPRRTSITCAPDPFAPDPKRQTTISVSFLLSDINDVFHSFVLSVICSLLTSGSTSPFYESLIASGIGADFSPGTGFSDFTRQSAFSVGVQGVTNDDLQTVERVVHQTLEDIANNGFPEEQLEALLHRLEMALKHVTGNFGFGISCSLSPVINHDADVFQSLRTYDAIERLRRELTADPDYLKKLVRKEFLENSHRLTLLMSPDEKYLQNLQEKEESLLKSIIAPMSEDEKKKLVDREVELLQVISKPSDTSVLPTLDVEKDISRDFNGFTLNRHSIQNVHVQTSIQKTNGINYLKVFFPIGEMDPSLTPYLPIFARFVSRVGAGDLSYREQDVQLRLKTGGLGSSIHTSCDKSNADEYESGILFTTSSLHRNDGQMYKLLQDVLSSPRFDSDPEHLKQLIRMATAEMAEGIAYAGNYYAVARASSHILPAAAFSEATGGLSHVLFMQQRSQEEDISLLLEKMQQIRKHFINRSAMRVSINTDSAEAEERNLKLLNELLAHVSTAAGSAKHSSNSSPDLSRIHREHHILNVNSNYLGKCVRTVPFAHEDYPPLQIAASLMTSKFLLREVREIGGAYGVRAASSPNLFSISSYRDPDPDRTIGKFEEAVQWLASGNFKLEDINEAKLSVFQSVDKPITPSQVGDLPFLQKISYEEKQKLRLALLSVSKDDLVRVASNHLVGRESGAAFAMLGPKGSQPRFAWQQIEH